MPRFVPLALALACTTAAAQAPQATDDPGAPGPRNQRIERIVVEDAGSRVEEVRYGGQTQSITVQPKGGMPAYEVEPGHGARRPAPQGREGSGAGPGQRFWNVLKF